jgi:hypothetical protein
MSRITRRIATFVVSVLAANAVYAAGSGNVALNKPTSATNSYSIYVPSRANDGAIDTIWNGGSLTECLNVDLQATYAIQTVVATSNQWGGNTTFQVSSSLDGVAWSPVGPVTTGTDGTPTFSFNSGGAQMRYIRFCTLAGSTQWATLSELEAYAAPAVVVPPAPVPTVSEWALMLSALLLALSGGWHVSRRRNRP